MRNQILRSTLFVCSIGLACVCVGCPAEPGDEPAPNQNDNAPAPDPAMGEQTFTTARTTAGGADLSCSSCHGNDGSGNVGPDIRRSDAAHLKEHAQGDGPHPEGVKFPDLTDDDFADIAAYLAEQCEADADCTAGGDEDHDHDEP